MNNLQKITQIFRQLRTSWQFIIFALLLMITCLFGRLIYRFYHELNRQIEESKIILQQQQTWMEQRTKICNDFDEIVAKIEAKNQDENLSLAADIEEVISHLNCKYELSNESETAYDDVTLSSVWVNLYNTNIYTFVQFCSGINAKNFNFGETQIRVLKNDTLNIKCLVESIKLVQR